MLKIRSLFSQIKRDHIINSSYQQLVDRIARTYNLKQYKNQSGLALLQIHHQFQIFKPGDWVLDVGSGVNYAWTDLAIKLTQNDQATHKVFSNDVLDLKKNRPNNVFIRGNIRQEPVRTQIALELENRNLDTILVDYSPQFSGNIQRDGRQIFATIGNVMDFAHNFLKKGGNLVCKVLQSEVQPILDETFQTYFNEKYKYVPSIVRKTSPVCFYVMKGFLISQSYYALCDLFRNYKGTPQRKIKIVQKYQGKYHWDPIKMVRKYVLDNILQLKSQGRPEKDIIKMYASDPFAKAEKILKLLKQADQAQKDRNLVLHAKIINQLTQGQLYQNSVDFPQTSQQFYQKVVQKMESVVKQDKQKKTEKKDKILRAPLKQNQTYMKIEDRVKEASQTIQKKYFQGDLQGRYSEGQTKDQIDQQIQKIQSVHPEIAKIVQQVQSAEKSKQTTIQQILDNNKQRYQQLSAEQLRNMHESVMQYTRKMSHQDLAQDQRLQRSLYRQNLKEETEQKSQRWVNQRRSRRKKPLY